MNSGVTGVQDRKGRDSVAVNIGERDVAQLFARVVADSDNGGVLRQLHARPQSAVQLYRGMYCRDRWNPNKRYKRELL